MVLSPARPSPDAIWIGRNGQESRYFRGRALAEAALRDLIAQELAAGRRLLIGFDFPFGYPAGFAARLTGVVQAQAKSLAARLAATDLSGEADRARAARQAAEALEAQNKALRAENDALRLANDRLREDAELLARSLDRQLASKQDQLGRLDRDIDNLRAMRDNEAGLRR